MSSLTIFFGIVAFSVVGILYALVVFLKEGKREADSALDQFDPGDAEAFSLDSLVEKKEESFEANKINSVDDIVKELKASEEWKTVEAPPSESLDQGSSDEAPGVPHELVEVAPPVYDESSLSEASSDNVQSKNNESFLEKFKGNIFKKKKDPVDEIVHGVFEAIGESRDVGVSSSSRDDSSKSKFSLFKKKTEETSDANPVDDFSSLEEEAPSEFKDDVPKESLLNKINIFKKKEKEEQKLATEHYTSLKDFMEKTKGKEKTSYDNLSFNVSEEEKSDHSDSEIADSEESDSPFEESSDVRGTASLRVGVVSEKSSDSSDNVSDEENVEVADQERPLLMADVIEESVPEDISDGNGEKGLQDVEDLISESEALSKEAESSEAPIDERHDPAPVAQPEVQADQIVADSLKEETHQIQGRESDFPDKTVAESDESLQSFKELEGKFESLNKLLKEKNEELQRAQEVVQNELKNREDYEKVKDILEQELIEVKERSRQVQQEKESLQEEFTKTNSLIPDLEEKAARLEEELLKREDELRVSVEKYEELESELDQKNKAVEEHLQQLSSFQESSEGLDDLATEMDSGNMAPEEDGPMRSSWEEGKEDEAEAFSDPVDDFGADEKDLSDQDFSTSPKESVDISSGESLDAPHVHFRISQDYQEFIDEKNLSDSAGSDFGDAPAPIDFEPIEDDFMPEMIEHPEEEFDPESKVSEGSIGSDFQPLQSPEAGTVKPVETEEPEVDASTLTHFDPSEISFSLSRSDDEDSDEDVIPEPEESRPMKLVEDDVVIGSLEGEGQDEEIEFLTLPEDPVDEDDEHPDEKDR